MVVMTSPLPWPPSQPSPTGREWPTYQQQGHLPWPGYVSPPPRESYGVLRDLPVVAALVLLMALVGVPAGLLWHEVSAKPAAQETADGGFLLPANVDKNYFGGDAAFLAVTVVAGLATGALAWAVTRGRGPAAPVGIAVGGVVGSVVARAVGERPVINSTLDRVCGVDPSYADICTVYDGHLRLRSISVLVVWALAAVAVHLVLTAVMDRRNQHDPAPPAGWYRPDAGIPSSG
jgi:hypothetical protein